MSLTKCAERPDFAMRVTAQELSQERVGQLRCRLSVGLVGGIILAVGKSRAQIQTIVEEDPFCELGLADFRIIEFRASQRADDIQNRIEKY